MGWAAALLITVAVAGAAGTRVRLVNNGYTGLVVGVDDRVDILQCREVLRNLQTLLSAASAYLYTATNQRAFFRDVTVVVPSSWPRSCTGATPPGQATTESYLSADLRVSGHHPVHGAAPWTHQSGLCGQPGAFIQFAADYVASGETHRYGDQARVLVHEWARYRWGVFEETGYPGDRLYPSFYQQSPDQWRPTGCSNRPVSGSVSPSGCPEDSNTCTFVPFLNASNDAVTSSIMYLQSLAQVRHFCNASNHDRSAPTKHNLVCGGRSVWEVMQTHEDFLLRNNPANASATAPPPAFRVVKATADRLFLLLESSATMRHQERWDFVSNSIRKFVNWDVPTGIQVGIGHFGAAYHTDRNLTTVPDSRIGRGELANLPPIADDVTEDKKSWRAAVDGALAALGDRAAGTTLVWVTGNQPNSRSQPSYGDVQYIIGVLKERKVRLVMVFYPSVTPGLARAATETGGDVITVDDVRLGDQTSITVFQALANAYRFALERYISDKRKLLVRLEERRFVGNGRQARGGFLIDSTLGVNTTLTVLYHDRGDIGYVKLKRPGGQMEPVYTYPDSTNHLQYVKIDTVHGQWEYEIDNLAPSHSSIYVQVTSSPSSSEGTVRAEVWTNADRAGNINATQQPLIIYASVMQGNAPVMDAEVYAIVTRPDGQETRLQLLDNGLAVPDVLRGDGIYSRYFTELGDTSDPELLLRLRVTVGGSRGRVVTGRDLLLPRAVPVDGSTPCCGSSVGAVTSVPVTDLRRAAAGGAVKVTLPPSGQDVLPPSQVTDLRAEVDPAGQTITFNWTAPGDDFDKPNTRVARYEVRYSDSPSQLRDHFTDCMGVPTWSEPEPAGSASSATVLFHTVNTLLFFAIRGADAAGNLAPLSNVVSLVMLPPPPTPSPPPPTGTTAPVQPTAPPFDNQLLLIVLLCVAGVIVLIVLLAMYYFLLYRRQKPEPDSGLQGYVNTVAMTTEISRESTPVKVPFDPERDGFAMPVTHEIGTPRWAPPDILQTPAPGPAPLPALVPAPGLGPHPGRARYNSYQTPYVEDMAFDGRSLDSTPPGGSVASLASAGRPRPDAADSPWGRGADGRGRLGTSAESWSRGGDGAGRLDSPAEPWARGGASPGSVGSQSSRGDPGLGCGDLGVPNPARPADRRRRNVTQV